MRTIEEIEAELLDLGRRKSEVEHERADLVMAHWGIPPGTMVRDKRNGWKGRVLRLHHVGMYPLKSKPAVVVARTRKDGSEGHDVRVWDWEKVDEPAG